MYFAVDTETAGLTAPAALSVAAAVLAADGAIIEEFYTLVQPAPDVIIDPDAFAAHGLTLERCLAEGRPKLEVVQRVARMAQQARIFVAYNAKFDRRVLTQLFNEVDHAPFALPVNMCVMEFMTGVCKIPGKWGKYKWPKLAEAYHHAFNRELKGAHNARTDLKATCEIFAWWLQSLKALAPAQTHLARNV